MNTSLKEAEVQLIEEKLLERFESHKEEEIQAAIYAVVDELRASGWEDLTDQMVRQVYLAVMMC